MILTTGVKFHRIKLETRALDIISKSARVPMLSKNGNFGFIMQCIVLFNFFKAASALHASGKKNSNV